MASINNNNSCSTPRDISLYGTQWQVSVLMPQGRHAIWRQWRRPSLSCLSRTSGSGYFLSAPVTLQQSDCGIDFIGIGGGNGIDPYPCCGISVKDVLETA